MDFEEVFVETENTNENQSYFHKIQDFANNNPQVFIICTSFITGMMMYFSIKGLIASGVHAGNRKTFKYLRRHPELFYRVLY